MLRNQCLFFFMVGLCCTFGGASACTSFSKIENNRTILTKVRDTYINTSSTTIPVSTYKEEVKFFNQGTYPYLALIYSQVSSQGVPIYFSAGTNKMGLSVTLNYDTVQKDRIAKEYGTIATQETRVATTLLQNASTVAEANQIIKNLQDQQQLVPCLLTIVDKTSSEVVEISDMGNQKTVYAIKTSDNRQETFITNHFDISSLKVYNDKIPVDSQMRYDRIALLLENQQDHSYTLNTGLQFAKDRDAGEINSIFRAESRATYEVEQTETRAEVFVELMNVAQIYNRADIILDASFWSNHKDGDVIVDIDKPYATPAILQYKTY